MFLTFSHKMCLTLTLLAGLGLSLLLLLAPPPFLAAPPFLLLIVVE